MPDTVTAPAIDPITGPIRADHRTRITPETSRILQVKAQAALAAKRAIRASKAAEPIPAPERHPEHPVTDPFVSYSLAKARLQLKKLYQLLESEELTPAEIDKISSSIAKFSVVEQNLAGRPGPGTLKPGETKSVQSRAGWLLGGETSEIPNKTPLNVSSGSDQTRSEQE